MSNSNDPWLAEQLAEIQLRLESSDAGIRRIALLDLAELDEPETVHLFLTALRQDADTDVRAEAARLLAAWEQDDVVHGLCHALTDAEGHVHDTAAQSLTEFKLASSGLIILPWAQHGDDAVRIAALRALRELRLTAGFDSALANLSHHNPLVRREAVTVVGWLKNPAALAELAELATHDVHPEVRRAATGALGYASHEDVLPALLAALDDEVWQVREEAAHTLGKLKLAAAGDALIKRLKDPYWQVRIHVARSLGKLKALQATQPLIAALGHDISNLRKEAALALGEIGDRAAEIALNLALTDPDPEVRKAVRIALASIQAQVRS